MRPTELAVRFFELLDRKDVPALEAFLHPSVSFAPTMYPNRIYRGRTDVMQAFYRDVLSSSSYGVEGSTFTDLDDRIATVEGRIRFDDGSGAVHDREAFWVLVFEDDTLLVLEGVDSREALDEVAAAWSARPAG
jgi:hypothetical protein